MGQKVRVICRKCGYSKTICVGSSMFCKSEKLIENSLKGNAKDWWDKLRESSVIIGVDSIQHIGYCRNCNDYKTLFCAKAAVENAENVIYFQNDCEDCGMKLEIINKNSDIVCPICKDEIMDKRDVGKWE